MSNRRFVGIVGTPYVAFACTAGGLDTLPQFGLAGVDLTFRVESLPEQNASADEIHPLFSFIHDTGTQPAMLEVGITPSGRVAARAKSTSVWQTGISRILDATAWHTLSVGYDGASGAWTTTFDGTDDNSVVDPSPSYLVPSPGYATRLMLFNGRQGLTKMSASISAALATFVGAARNTTLTWSFSSRAGDSIPVALTTSDGGASEMAGVGPLVAEFWNPLFFTPWGSVPTGSPTGQYRRGLETDWVRRAKPTTNWTRVAA